MSRALSSSANSGLSDCASPTIASTTAPPFCGPCFKTSEAGSHAAASPRLSASALSFQRAPLRAGRAPPLLGVGRDPDGGDRDEQDPGDQHPGRPVDLPLQPAPGTAAAATPPVPAPA